MCYRKIGEKYLHYDSVVTFTKRICDGSLRGVSVPILGPHPEPDRRAPLQPQGRPRSRQSRPTRPRFHHPSAAQTIQKNLQGTKIAAVPYSDCNEMQAQSQSTENSENTFPPSHTPTSTLLVCTWNVQSCRAEGLEAAIDAALTKFHNYPHRCGNFTGNAPGLHDNHQPELSLV